MEKHTYRSPFDTPNANFLAEMGVPAVMNFNLFANMGRMNGGMALTRKNALFAGSDGGGGHWATIASLVETAKLNGVDPQAYLADDLARIVSGHPQSRIDELLPWAFGKASAEAVA